MLVHLYDSGQGPLLGILGSDEQHNAVNLPTTASCGPVVTGPCREAAALV